MKRKPQATLDQQTLFELPPTRRPDKSKVKSVGLRPLWTEHKARLIERYLYYFVLVTRHGTYIDGFAGPQGSDDNWAAKRVLESEPPWLRHFYLFEIDPPKVTRLDTVRTEHPNRGVKIFPGDFNKQVSKILSLKMIGEKEATFCLIDQRTFECHWATVEKLARHKQGRHKIEIFYFLANHWFARALGGIKGQRARLWWGRDDWQSLGDMHGSTRARILAERFKDELGYVSARPWAIYDKEHGRRVMYYMIHAADHPKAPELMSRAYEKVVQPKESLEQLAIELGLPKPGERQSEASRSNIARRAHAHQPLGSGRPTA